MFRGTAVGIYVLRSRQSILEDKHTVVCSNGGDDNGDDDDDDEPRSQRLEQEVLTSSHQTE